MGCRADTPFWRWHSALKRVILAPCLCSTVELALVLWVWVATHLPHLGGTVELALVPWLWESQPQGHERGRAGSTPCWLWLWVIRTYSSPRHELALVAWVRESWPLWCECKRASPDPFLLLQAGKLSLPHLPGKEGDLVVAEQESWLADKLSYHPGEDLGP